MQKPKFIFIIAIALILGCEKDPPIPDPIVPVMPPLTHQGLNTFGCYIDGELFVAKGGDSYWDFPAIEGIFDEITKRITIRAARYTKSDLEFKEFIDFSALLTDHIGQYDFLYNEEVGSNAYTNSGGDKCDYYFKKYPDFNLGKLNITHLDETKNIISGTFYMNLINEDCTEGDTVLNITDGRFDLSY